MPNIDTRAANLSGSGGRRAATMLGRLPAAAAPLVVGNGIFYTANDNRGPRRLL